MQKVLPILKDWDRLDSNIQKLMVIQNLHFGELQSTKTHKIFETKSSFHVK